MQYWEHGVALPDTVEGHVHLRNAGQFVRRNRFRLVAAVAALAVATAGLPAAAGAPSDKGSAEAAVAFPTADFEDPVFDAAADAIAAAAAFAGAAAAPEEAPAGPAAEGASTPPAAPPSNPPAPEAPSNEGEGGSEEIPPLGAEAIDFSIRLTPAEVGADGTFRAELVAVNTGDRTARATVSSVDFTLNGPDGALLSGNYGIGLPVTVEAGEEFSIGITVSPYMLSWLDVDLPDVIQAGTYSGPVTINVKDAAPVTHDVSITYTEDIDLAAWAAEQCQAAIDGWNDGEVAYSASLTDGGDVTFGSEVVPWEPPTLEECLSWYGF